MARLGIVRVTDITRLDRLGVPVFASVRPRGQTLRVHAGKALHPEEARVGALMEAIEFALAELASGNGVDATMSIRRWEAQLPHGLVMADFAPRLGAAVRPLSRLPLCRCEHLASGATVLMPAELLQAPCNACRGAEWFGWSTNGLASGNSLAEATLHALLEILERDALAINRARDQSRRVIEQTLPAPLQSWAAQWRRLGIELVVRQVPNAMRLACFEARLHEASSLDVNIAGGSGLHPDRRIAVTRAVCEAAQSRLSTIHGGRDDITRFYDKYSATADRDRHAREAEHMRGFASDTDCVAFDAVPDRVHRSVDSALKRLLHDLPTGGFGEVFRMRLEHPLAASAGLHVVKLVVARAEAAASRWHRIGPRLWHALGVHG